MSTPGRSRQILRGPSSRRLAAAAETVKAVDGVSFAIVAGETFGVIGESGSGKSTLGRVLVCLLKPTAGTLTHDGIDPYALQRRATAAIAATSRSSSRTRTPRSIRA